LFENGWYLDVDNQNGNIVTIFDNAGNPKYSFSSTALTAPAGAIGSGLNIDGTSLDQNGPGGSLEIASLGVVSSKIAHNAVTPYKLSRNYGFFGPFNPLGTNSTTKVMMGMGGTVTLTPKNSFVTRIIWKATAKTATALTNTLVNAYYGTGAAPANGAAPTGTALQTQDDLLEAGAVNTGATVFFVSVIILTGQAYWFDLALATGNTSDTASLSNVYAYVEEIA
jgi:hypothetical protein